MQQSNKYLYTLQKNKKHECPACKKKTFTRFVGLPEIFGICDRVNNCGYSLTPTKDNLQKNHIGTDFLKNYKPVLQEVQYILPNATIAVKEKSLFDSNLHKFLLNNLKIKKEHLKKWNLYGDTLGYTTFLYYNEQGQFANYQKVAYKQNGKRVKNGDPEAENFKSLSFSLKQPADTTKRYKKPLYGLWQITEERYLHKPIAIVESQKTAIIASYFYDDLCWIACDSANGLSLEKLATIAGREVWWISDADKAGRENSSLRHLKETGANYLHIDLTPDLADGSDIADLLVQGKKPIFYKTEINTDTGEIGYRVIEDFIYREKKEEQVEEELPSHEVTHSQLNLPKHIDIDLYIKKGFYEDEHKYYVRKKTKDSDYPERVSNFSITPLFYVESQTQESFRVLELVNIFKRRAIVVAKAEDLTSVTKFQNLCEAKGNFIFEGDIKALTAIKRDVYFKTKHAQHITTDGWQTEGFWAWQNGIFDGQNQVEYDKYGIVRRGNAHYYYAVSSEFNKNQTSDANKFIYKKSTIDFKKWAQMFHKIYSENSNGAIGILFYCATLFADEVISKIKAFPLLNLFGRPQSGKSTMSRSLTMMFGEEITPIGLGNQSTPKSLVRLAAQKRNAFVWYDEFKNNIGESKIALLKNFFDRTGYSKAEKSNDNATSSTPINAVAIVSGQEAPTQDIALFTRCIVLTFNKNKFSQEGKDEYASLLNLEQIGLSSITNEVLKHRPNVESQFYAKFREIQKRLSAKISEVSDRIITSYSVLLSIYEVLSQFLEFPFQPEFIYKLVEENIAKQQENTSTATDMQKFWDIVQYLYDTGKLIDEEDFQVIGGKLYLRMSKLFSLYSQYYYNQHRTQGLDKTTLMNYIVSAGAELTKKKRFKNTVTSCFIFNYFELQEQYGINLVRLGDFEFEQEKIQLASNETNNQEREEEFPF